MEVKTFIGKIRSLNKTRAYGHLTPSWAINDDDNIFFHFTRTVPHKCFLELDKEVLFQLEQDSKGRWMAVSLLDTRYSRLETINRARMMKQRPDFLPDSCILREQREQVKKEEVKTHKAKSKVIIESVENNKDTEEFVAHLLSTKEV